MIAGAGRGGERLLDALAAGIGPSVRDWLKTAFPRVEQGSISRWFDEEKKTSLQPTELPSIEGRTDLRLKAENIRAQESREVVGAYALRELRSLQGLGLIATDPPPIDFEWLTRFWRFAQDVTNDDLRQLWGTVLARQACGSGDTSMLMMEALSMLEAWEVAELIRIAGMVLHVKGSDIDEQGIISRIAAQGPQQSEQERLNKRLEQIIGSETFRHFGSLGLFSMAAWNPSIAVMSRSRCSLAGTLYQVRDSSRPRPDNLVFGFLLSGTGRRIIELIPTYPKNDYVAALMEGFELMERYFIPAPVNH